MSFRVTRANPKQVVEAMGEVTTAWENVEESITTWMITKTSRRPTRMGATRGA